MATKPSKAYDAVADLRRIRDQLAEELSRLDSPEERIGFLRQLATEGRRKCAARQGRHHKS